jgi:hypothetical protein
MPIRQLFVFSLVCALGAPAFANCFGEAQIIAKVGFSEKTHSSCRVFPDESSIKIYNESGACPLDLGLVIQAGVEVGFSDGHDCRLTSGDVLTGVLVLQPSGTITLE